MVPICFCAAYRGISKLQRKGYQFFDLWKTVLKKVTENYLFKSNSLVPEHEMSEITSLTNIYRGVGRDSGEGWPAFSPIERLDFIT